MKRKQKLRAFTLAEVLITLVIIGVIAALTVPTVMNNVNETALISQLKKTYATCSRVLLSSYQRGKSLDDVLSEVSAGNKNEAAIALKEYFAPYLNIVKDCGLENGQCFKDNYKRLNGGSYSFQTSKERYRVKLADGSAIIFYVWDTNAGAGCVKSAGTLNNICGEFFVDVNGDKGPNIQGIDFFSFWITETGLIPEGAHGNVTELVEEDCLDKSTANGWNCAAWVLAKGNMDYRHCSGLHWNGPITCEQKKKMENSN